MSCSVKFCKSMKRLRDKSVSFHRFPKDQNRLALWMQALNINSQEWKWSMQKFICSKHFKKEDFREGSFSGSRLLKTEAVPSQLLNLLNLSQRSDTSQNTSTIASTSVQSVGSGSSSGSITREKTLTETRRKRRLTNLQQQSSSGSTSSDGKRRKVAFIKKMHSYSKSPTFPIRRNEQLKKKQTLYRQKLSRSKKRIDNLQKRVLEMKNVIDFLKNQELSEASIDHINQAVSDVPQLLMRRYLNNVRNGTVSHQNYPEPLRRFATTLQFYSSRAYEAIRQEFALALPDQATIRKWYTNVDCDPSYLDQAFHVLKQKAEEAKEQNRELVVSMVVDEMNLKKQIEYDGKRMWGYVDIGNSAENDQVEVAGEALVILIVRHQACWKLPIAYFLIKSLSGAEKASIVREAIKRLTEINVTVTSVTCDGPAAHFSMFNSLGCKIDATNGGQDLDSSFVVENTGKIFAIFDACHMIKLVRNNLAALEIIKDPDGKEIKWEYIQKLHDLQEKETLKLGNKISKKHVDFANQTMKVSLAAQTLSQSMADALKFLRVDMKHPDFKHAEATENFFVKVNRLFDILNTRSPYGRGDKAALKATNEHLWGPFLQEMVEYLLRCSNSNDRPLYLTRNKTPFLGFAITIRAVCGIYDQFVKTKMLNYLLTYKLSQDHLETLFCAIRCRNGWNNNPTPLQFKYALRRILLHTRISGHGGNCRVIDSTVVLSVPSRTGRSEESIDLSVIRKYGLDINNLLIDEDEYDITPFFIPLNEICTNVVAYMSGYVIKMLEKRNICLDCLDSGVYGEYSDFLQSNYKLIARKDRGGLRRPSQGLIKICEKTEIVIRQLMNITNNQLPVERGFQSTLVVIISQKFYPSVNILFPVLEDHFQDTSFFEENHSFILVKRIVGCYIRIRFFNLAKKNTERIQGENVRKKLSKLILFNHQ